MDELSADGRIFHKTCFRCTHCSKVLTLSNYASMNDKVYCKPHFNQLFKEKGSYDGISGEEKKVYAGGADGVGGDKCAGCGKTVYATEKFEAADKIWHAGCFRCSDCQAKLSLTNYTASKGVVYCRLHVPTLTPKIGMDSVAFQDALNAPKRDEMVDAVNRSQGSVRKESVAGEESAVAEEAAAEAVPEPAPEPEEEKPEEVPEPAAAEEEPAAEEAAAEPAEEPAAEPAEEPAAEE
ncbi:hypothetical protein CYMTET_50275 [Cymbomonas tetramitiformis]|uniref:LIM zinc-binding domain-containing protein n=1 Tax=Cymbomonas tetramitiformis TaxID=36881 RepID=A0AAE0BQ30_9CHLO|nr:hypothetical protein CYMTET_50275 [Cymbomonas tetramitiformis]